MTTRAPTPSSGRTIREEPEPVDVPLVVHPGWRERFPWLVQGLTTRGSGDGYDLALFGSSGGGAAVWERWQALLETLEMPAAVHGRQVHGRRVALHREMPPGLFLRDGVDGHATAAAGVLLTVALADCVPVFLVAPDRRAAALLHAGWRGVARGILERGVDCFRDRLAVEPGELAIHLGPAICGACYEVGPEVHRALGRPGPGEARPVDLRGALLERARKLGIPEERSSCSSHCTRCGDGGFYSHRGGDVGRQVAVLGVRAGAGASGRG